MDPDNSPEPFHMLVNGDTVYLILQHLDRTQSPPVPLAPGEIVVIDATLDTVATVIPLATPNPSSDLPGAWRPAAPHGRATWDYRAGD